MLTGAEVRRGFIEFFEGKSHKFVPSSPVVPHADPTLLFTNAGMNQFKPYFLGTEHPKHKRAANTQKCIRAGGKHNDLDDVGHDTYHHTFFEMLGNWSFGDYFKKEAINWAWELLVDVWGVAPERLHATYFEGDDADGIEPDMEAMELWAHLLPAGRIHPGNKKDNFWEMGDTGPCGPCSEIHVDLTPDKSGAELVNAGDPRVIEIWNLVFIQFNRGPDGKLTPLPAKHVDTGMGFERITALLQGKDSNYDTDIFTPLFEAIRGVTGARAYQGLVPGAIEGQDEILIDTAYRVITDHVRCLTFALTDGAVPDKDGRGYVLRRILRRAVRYGWQHFNMHEPFLHKLVPTVVDTMGEAFPELTKNPQHVIDIVHEEEQSFGRTLDRGIALFEDAAEAARKGHHHEINGEDAFKLHDTYGFPIDLTQIMADEKGLRVDIGEYERLMEEARERARGTGRAEDDEEAQLIHDVAEKGEQTDDAGKYDRSLECDTRLTSLAYEKRPGDTDSAKEGQTVAFTTAETCFYVEAGGQVSDTGLATTASGEIEVSRVEQHGAVIVHSGRVVRGEIQPGAKCHMRVSPRRLSIMQNHTATHVLNWALREVLGDGVQQKGSLVDDEKTRFDFSHSRALTDDEISRIEDLVNEKIAQKLAVHDEYVPQEQALKIKGLRAVFGEKYPETVRVMSIGVPIKDLLASPDSDEWRDVSIEFCGGTHCANTSEIEQFALTTEEAVAKGIRRVVGVTGGAARQAHKAGQALVDKAKALQQTSGDTLPRGIGELQQALAGATITLRQRHQLRDMIAELQKAAKKQQKEAASDAAEVVKQKCKELIAAAEHVDGHALVVGEMPDVPVEQLKHGADMIKQKCRSAVILFGVKAGAKAMLLAAVTDDLIKRGIKAGDLVKEAAKHVNGGGGGPPTMAQAGGKNPEKLSEALDAGRAWIKAKLT